MAAALQDATSAAAPLFYQSCDVSPTHHILPHKTIEFIFSRPYILITFDFVLEITFVDWQITITLVLAIHLKYLEHSTSVLCKDKLIIIVKRSSLAIK